MHIFTGAFINNWTHIGIGLGASTDLACTHHFSKFFVEFIGNAFLHEDAVCRSAGFTHIAQFCSHGTFDRGIQVCVVEDDKGGITAELHRGAQYIFTGIGQQSTTYRS